MHTRAHHTRLALFLVAGLVACGGESPGFRDGGPGPAPDTGVGMDASTDGGPDAARDAAVADAGRDAAPTDAPADAGVDAGSCGSGPACAEGESCWGTGCSCIMQADGDSYLRSDGTVVSYRSSLHVVAVTAPDTPLTGVVQIMDGWRHTCGLRDDGTVWCWGKAGLATNQAGELGNGSIGGTTTAMLASQVLIAADTPLTGIVGLNDQSSSRCYIEQTTCGIRGADGAVFCWGGDNTGGGVGSFYTEGRVGSRPYATQIMASEGVALEDVVQVELGIRHACARTGAGAILCWGANVGGPLGQGDQLTRQYPISVALPGDASADEIGVGSDFTCARTGGTVYCWGASTQGQIGLGDPRSDENHDGCINFCKMTPAQVIDGSGDALTGVVDLEVAYLGACARLADHTLRCWGADVGQVATEPVVAGGVLSDLAQVTTCSSTGVPTAIRWVLRDGTLHVPGREVTAVCAE